MVLRQAELTRSILEVEGALLIKMNLDIVSRGSIVVRI